MRMAEWGGTRWAHTRAPPHRPHRKERCPCHSAYEGAVLSGWTWSRTPSRPSTRSKRPVFPPATPDTALSRTAVSGPSPGPHRCDHPLVCQRLLF